MRPWFKYFLIDADASVSTGKDETFAENAKTMGYAAQEGFGSREDFLKTYYWNNHPRFRIYDELLRGLLKKGQNILSVASGRSVNEILLMEAGIDVTCSDLEVLKPLKILFPNLKFVPYDIRQGPFQGKTFDVVLALQVLYLFDKPVLGEILNNFKKSLNDNGRLIIDISGAEDNLWTRLIDNFITWYEAHLKCIIVKLVRGQKQRVLRKHHGFRYTDMEFIDIVQAQGFRLNGIYKADYATELERSFILRRIGQIDRIFKRGIEYLGRRVPYIRLFVFDRIS